jgi:hypothetical protein
MVKVMHTKCVFLFLVFLQTFWFTACEDTENTSPKTILALNIPATVISKDTMDKMIADNNNNSSISFRQEPDSDNFIIDPDGLYLMVLFVPATFVFESVADALALYDDIQKGKIESKDALDFGSAIALPKVSGGTAERHILTFTANESDAGYYWDGISNNGMGDTSDEHYIFTLLITPDARFILRSDFFFKGGVLSPTPSLTPFKNSNKYTIDFNAANKSTMFKTDLDTPPEELLPDDFIDYFAGRLS